MKCLKILKLYVYTKSLWNTKAVVLIMYEFMWIPYLSQLFITILTKRWPWKCLKKPLNFHLWKGVQTLLYSFFGSVLNRRVLSSFMLTNFKRSRRFWLSSQAFVNPGRRQEPLASEQHRVQLPVLLQPHDQPVEPARLAQHPQEQGRRGRGGRLHLRRRRLPGLHTPQHGGEVRHFTDSRLLCVCV